MGARPLDDRAPSTLSGEQIEAAPERDLEAREDKKERASDVSEEGGEDDVEDVKPGLPFSKARCIALVATLTGASFLNVCLGRPYNQSMWALKN